MLDENGELTYGQLLAEIRRLAKRLQERKSGWKRSLRPVGLLLTMVRRGLSQTFQRSLPESPSFPCHSSSRHPRLLTFWRLRELIKY